MCPYGFIGGPTQSRSMASRIVFCQVGAPLSIKLKQPGQNIPLFPNHSLQPKKVTNFLHYHATVDKWLEKLGGNSFNVGRPRINFALKGKPLKIHKPAFKERRPLPLNLYLGKGVPGYTIGSQPPADSEFGLYSAGKMRKIISPLTTPANCALTPSAMSGISVPSSTGQMMKCRRTLWRITTMVPI